MIGIAFTLIIPVFIGLYLGSFYDKYNNFKFPVGVIIGGFLGMFSGLYNLYKSNK